MRLWHEDLIPYLPANQINGMHKEISGMERVGGKITLLLITFGITVVMIFIVTTKFFLTNETTETMGIMKSSVIQNL